MLSDGIQKAVSGRLSAGLKMDESISSVVIFIEEQLRIFRNKYLGKIDTNEDTLNEWLVIIFQRNIGARPFFFKAEKIQNPLSGSSAKTDVGVLSMDESIYVRENSYYENEAFFEIECKRLPTPGQNREREYVVGYDTPSGGIERFKKGIHAKNLHYASIIGYIQKENSDFWFLTINTWISELITSTSIWNDKDKLVKDKNPSDEVSKFISENSKEIIANQNSLIRIFHFWINLVS